MAVNATRRVPHGERLASPQWGYCYAVIILNGGSTEILRIRPPLISMMVRPSKGEDEAMRLLTIENYMTHLKIMNKIYVHRYDVPVKLEGSTSYLKNSTQPMR